MSVLPAAEVQQSPELALQGLYERHADRIFGFCLRRLKSRPEAEDAVQETFVCAMRALKRGCVPLCESAWLFKIAENVCCTMYRSAIRRNTSNLGSLEEVERLPAQDSDGAALFGLEEALAAIPSNQRRAFVLRELRGLSYKEIALQLGVSVASVETLIYRARRGIARALESGAGLRERMTSVVNLGSIAAAVKSWLAGMTAVKIAAASAVVAVAAVSAGDSAPRPSVSQPAASLQPVEVTSSASEDPGRSVGKTASRRPGVSSGSTRDLPSSSRARPGTPAPGQPRNGTPPQSSPDEVGGSVPGAPAAPAVPGNDGPVPVEQPQSPQVPQTPEVPQVPQVPQIPQVPQLDPVDLPELPVTIPETPSLPKLPDIPGLDEPDPNDLLPELPRLP